MAAEPSPLPRQLVSNGPGLDAAYYATHGKPAVVASTDMPARANLATASASRLWPGRRDAAI